MKHVLFVAAGGALGAATRFLVSNAIQKRFAETSFPFGTLTVNVVGCFLIGCFLRSLDSTPIQSQELKLFLVSGFLGALTTFSTFGYETYVLQQQNGISSGVTNVLANVVLTLIAVACGIYTGKFIFR